MRNLFGELEKVASPTALLGYLNFSDGTLDTKWQQQFHAACAFLVEEGAPRHWEVLQQWLLHSLQALHQQKDKAAFRNIEQAQQALESLPVLLRAYREHHDFQLAHLTEEELFQPFFLIRALEAILSEMSSTREETAIIHGSLTRLNDFVGYRPIAILETRPQAEPYPKERFRPIPIYLRGVGASAGPYQTLVEKTLQILQSTDSYLLHAAHFDFDRMEEMAVDARSYDQRHPVNRRPNYIFGEWDPHCLDEEGMYRRFVARQLILDALIDYVRQTGMTFGGTREERLFEAAAVFAGTLLMATGVSGRSPTAHDASQSLGALIPGIARCRDAFYQQLIEQVPSSHRKRLKQDEARAQQPFGSPRQHLNAWLGRHRARQLQHRSLAVLFAQMGYPDASRQEALRIPTASVRLLSAILSDLQSGRFEVGQGKLESAFARLPDIEDLLHKGIACGAVVDPWNILGFQGLFPLSAAQEDGAGDPRIDELLQIVQEILAFHAQLVSEAAAQGRSELATQVLEKLKAFAQWWDQFASTEVSDVRRVAGGEAASSAKAVAAALLHWHARGEEKIDMAFWRDHLETFQSSKAFSLVVHALLEKKDYHAAMALLANWLGHVSTTDSFHREQGADSASLEEPSHSFHELALRWMLGVTQSEDASLDQGKMVNRFFAILEANAEEYWEVPVLQQPEILPEPTPEEDRDDVYSAAYENVTWRDSTAGDEGAVVEGPTDIGQDFLLEEESAWIEKRLRIQSTLARLWQIAAHSQSNGTHDKDRTGFAMQEWLHQATAKRQQLLALMDSIQQIPVPAPLGSFDSLVEHDRRQSIKAHLLERIIATCLDMSGAIAALRAVEEAPGVPPGEEEAREWESALLQLEKAFLHGDRAGVRTALKEWIPLFQGESILTVSLTEGGDPRHMLSARMAQSVLRTVLAHLPGMGMLYETGELLVLARKMERAQKLQKRGVTEMSHLFQTAFSEVIETVVSAMPNWQQALDDPGKIEVLNRLTAPFLRIWVEHTRTVQLSPIETVQEEEEWKQLVNFIQTYGHDLFHARFMTLSNLRGILLQGIDHYLDHLQNSPEALGSPESTGSVLAQPSVPLLEDLGQTLSREKAIRWLEIILRTVVAHYEEYKDYNASTAKSDYGENLYVLLEQLRVKIAYDRQAWQLLPFALVHEVLARQGHHSLARFQETGLQQMTRELAEGHLASLSELEQKHGAELSTVRDRLEERFVKPLALDRLCALVDPAIQAAGSAPGGEQNGDFAKFQEELERYIEVPSGSGLDVPLWLQKLEEEVHRSQNARTELLTLAESAYRSRRQHLSLAELEEQFQKWEQSS